MPCIKNAVHFYLEKYNGKGEGNIEDDKLFLDTAKSFLFNAGTNKNSKSLKIHEEKEIGQIRTGNVKTHRCIKTKAI